MPPMVKIERRADRRLATAILASGGLVFWQSKRRITTATSSSEAEYQALASSVKEARLEQAFATTYGFVFFSFSCMCG